MSAGPPSVRNRELLSDAIRSEVNSWPGVERQVFIYAHYEGKSRSEIADIFGLSLIQVCSILKEREQDLRMALRCFREENCRDQEAELPNTATTLEKCLG